LKLDLNGFVLELSMLAVRDGQWTTLRIVKTQSGFRGDGEGVTAELELREGGPERVGYELRFTSEYSSRVRLKLTLMGESKLFHLIPGNIHGDNNAAHVKAGQFPVLASRANAEGNAAPLWEFRADRASHPVSMLCCERGVVAVSIEPYSESIRNGVFAALPDSFGFRLGTATIR
jgi:hypothetical protein